MRIRKYETMVIARPEFEKDQIKDLVSRLKDRIERNEGQLQEVVDWGLRRLAYPIRVRGNRFFYGTYFLLIYVGNLKTINELEAYMKLMDDVIRFQTVKISDIGEMIDLPELPWKEQMVPEVRLREDGEGLEAVEPSRQRKLSREEMYRAKPMEKVAKPTAEEHPEEKSAKEPDASTTPSPEPVKEAPLESKSDSEVANKDDNKEDTKND